MRIAKRHRIIRKITLAVWALAVLVLATFLLTSDRFRIHTVTIAGDEPDALSIRDVIESNLAGAYLGLVPKDNLFVYPKSAIATNLHAINPGISKVNLARSLGGELTVSVILHSRDYIWCESEESVECRFLDENGQAYTTSSAMEGKFKIISAEHLNKEIFVNVQGVLSGLASSSLQASLVNVDGGKIVYNIDEGWQLRTNATDGSSAVLQRVKGAFTTEALKDPQVRATLDYLDVRLDNKMFYKFK